MKIMQLGFNMTTIHERFLFVSWRRKQRKLSRNNFALLIFDTLSVKVSLLQEKIAVSFLVQLVLWGFSQIFFFQ